MMVAPRAPYRIKIYQLYQYFVYTIHNVSCILGVMILHTIHFYLKLGYCIILGITIPKVPRNWYRTRFGGVK